MSGFGVDLGVALYPGAHSGIPAPPVSGALLLEDGFFLLLEDGSKILLE